MRPTPRRLSLPALGLALLSLSCGGDDGPTGPDPNEVATVTVTPSAASVDVGATVQLTAQARNSQGGTVNATVSWSSSATGVASVNASGLVTGVAAGTATITATAGGRSGSATVDVTAPTPPVAPSGLQADVVSNTRIELSWTDASDDETGFEIERDIVPPGAPGTDGGTAPLHFESVGTVGADVTTFTDDGLTPSTTYRYRVRAVNVVGESEFADPVEASTFATLSIETQSLAGGLLGEAYEEALSASGGDGSFAWSLLSGSLPSGVELSEQGVLSGTPTETGSFEIEVQVEGGGQTATASFTLTVSEEITAPTVVTQTLPEGVVGQAYSETLEAQGGDGNYTWSLTSGSFQEGLDLAADGTVSGTPTATGTVTVTVQVTSAGLSGSGEVSLTVGESSLTVTTTSLPEGQVAQAYQATLEAEGGAGEVSWSLLEGALPNGIDLSAEGALSGSPQEAGSFPLTVEATSAGDGQTATAELSLVVDPGPVTINSTTVASGERASSYSVTLVASGGDGSDYAWERLSGTLPSGLSLSTSGVLQGMPSQAEEQAFTVRVTSGGFSDTQELRLTIRPRPRAGYQIDLAYLTPVSSAQRAAFENAQARWSELITGDQPIQTGGIPQCGSFHPETQGTVDDLVIYVKVDSIDGPGGTLGQAGGCFFRNDWITLTGAMTFDEADLQNLANADLLEPVILHEMGHVLGIGQTWDNQGLFSGTCTEDPIFTGPRAIDAFVAAGGANYSGEPVPIENQGSPGDGTNCGHWRESVLDNELMTGFIDPGGNPLSAITVESLGDQGYEVDASAADSYLLPQPVPVGPVAARLEGVWLHDDIWRGPRYRISPDGRIRAVGGHR